MFDDDNETLTEPFFLAKYTIAGGSENPDINVATPTFTPAGSEVDPNTEVTITCTTNGASIYYTTDGSTPTASSTEYTAPIKITEAVTIKAIAILDGSESEVAEASYTVKEPVVVTVTFDPVSGTEVEPGTTCTITGTVSSGKGFAYYKCYATLDEAKADTWPDENYSDAGIAIVNKPIAISADKPVFRVSLCLNYTTWSEPAYASYTVKKPAEEVRQPEFRPEAGAVSKGTKVSIIYIGPDGVDKDVEIRYTTDNSEPTASSTLYNEEDGIIVNEEMTIKAIAIKDGKISEVATAAYTIAADASFNFSPNGGTVASRAQVTIRVNNAKNIDAYYYQLYKTKAEAEADALWSQNWGAFQLPSLTNAAPTTTVTIDEDHTIIRAGIAVAATGEFTKTDFYAEYTIGGAVEVKFSPADDTTVLPGTEVEIEGVGLSDDELIYYALFYSRTQAEASDLFKNADGFWDGYDAETLVESKTKFPVLQKDQRVIRAGIWNSDDEAWVATNFYAEYNVMDKVDMPQFSVEEGEVPVGTEVEISCDTADVTIYYSVNADTVTVNSTRYEDPISIDSDMTIWAIAVKEGLITSDIAKITYTVAEEEPEPEVTLSFTPATGTELEENDTITITPSDELDTEIFFAWFPSKASAEACTDEAMLNGEDVEVFFYGEPDEEDDQYAYPVFHAEKPVLKAGYMADMTEEGEPIFRWFYAEYKVKAVEQEKDTVAAPRFNPGAGEVKAGTEVEILCDTAGADIYYTTDGTTPTDKSTKYTAKIKIDSAMTIKAIAIKDGLVNSAVAEAAYTVKKNTANENGELAGVHLYPNPNDGNFKIEAPVAAKVEIFTANGMIAKTFTMPAGVTEVRLEHSGIYFVRLTADNGLMAVKRVIVR
ncbi:MAG: chitobiase/beta-hexosaminidase C-terminal domain-containing protein [Bacteroides sp.]|nr:chitobiase/beta-hexosaminidase C-terminal domain-containing protein [Ruminococcus flavefaciens]MCM1553984.1 chitobiase/beta-hexosaminidase C-terminal domain-containing protein [Bacteroides sp.]